MADKRKASANAAVNDAVTDWVTIDESSNARLATECSGQGPTFVWGHSLMGSMAMDLDSQVLAWRDLNDVATVVRFDARGHGLSELSGATEDFRWDNLAKNMWQVIDHYTNDKVVIGGASMGCATSLYAACQRPGQVEGLVLVIPPTAWELRKKMQKNYRFIAKMVNVSRGLPFRLLKFLPKGSDDRGFQKAMMKVMLRHLASANHTGIVGAMNGASLSDLPPRDELAKLAMPTLILAWPYDQTHPLSVAQELQQLLPNAELHVQQHPNDPYQWPQSIKKFITQLDLES